MSVYLQDRSLVSSEESSRYLHFLSEFSTIKSIDCSATLKAIPRPKHPSYAPLATLLALLQHSESLRWPALALQNTYSRLWQILPERSRAGHPPPAAQRLLDDVLQSCKRSYSSLSELFHLEGDSAAIIDPASGARFSHSHIARVVAQYPLQPDPITEGRRPVVAISLPNGPLLALIILATASYHTAAPIAYGSAVGAEQFKNDVLHSGARTIIAAASDVERLGLQEPWLSESAIAVVLVSLSDTLYIEYRTLDNEKISTTLCKMPQMNGPDDAAILLFTSGTTGSKKVVRLTLHNLICGVAMVIESWALGPNMRCLNQMPLNHVGGIVRNLFASVLSGGSIICCAGFDPNMFWDCVEDFAPTWYYASPSMHHCILAAARPQAVAKSNVRLVCNAAGGLLPSLARRLCDTFSHGSIECTILPSYGMTECMPISTPPLSHKLETEKTGTSGVNVGPEIGILSDDEELCDSGQIGRICVRGHPTFDGYVDATGHIDSISCKNKDSWFDTGDLGWLDGDGYLYITGRSKEVINRGGEIISPLEVEEAIIAAASTDPSSPIYGKIGSALAFSVRHAVLQEVVGLAIVTSQRSLRADLREIYEALGDTLSQIKRPEMIVYMDDGLPMNNNKVLRVRLAERLGLPELTDATPLLDRYFEAVSPPVSTALDVPIDCHAVDAGLEPMVKAVKAVLPEGLDVYGRLHPATTTPEVIVAPPKGNETLLDSIELLDIRQAVAEVEHAYHVPETVLTLREPLPRDQSNNVDEEVLDILIEQERRDLLGSPESLSMTEHTVRTVFAQILQLRESELDTSSNFFVLGGTSMAAGRLLAALREKFHLRLPIDDLFSHSQIGTLSHLIDQKINSDPMWGAKESDKLESPGFLGCTTTCSSTNPLVMFLQLVPIWIVYPMKRALTWLVFIYFLSNTLSWGTDHSVPGRLFNLVLSLFVGKTVTRVVAPTFAIAFKWMVIGRYREGLYPMWGTYHTRWWLTEKVVFICGKGVFSTFNWTRVLHLRLLGARIGRNVSIDAEAAVGEWDLVSIGNDVVLDRLCKVRPFAAECNTSMYLGRISIGDKASIGICSIVASGTSVAPNTCIGPNSSSWEQSQADESFRSLPATKIAPTHWLLYWCLQLPLLGLVTFTSMLPWLGCLVPIVLVKANGYHSDALVAAILWFSSPIRVGLHYGALAANTLLGPSFFLFGALAIKSVFDLIFGRLTPLTLQKPSAMVAFRRNLYNEMLSVQRFAKVSSLLGGHYEGTSVLARLLGARVGKRVYWPGNLASIQDWDLINIEDDVIFGSRSHIITSDGAGSAPVRIGAGAMVADRVTLLPGADIEQNAVMGSGAITRRGGRYPANTTWVGSRNGDAICLAIDLPAQMPASKQSLSKDRFSLSAESSASAKDKDLLDSTSTSDLEKGEDPYEDFSPESSDDNTIDPRELKDDPGSTSSPFGRAFYQCKAPYRVWSQTEIFIYSVIITLCCAVFWNISSISALQIIGRFYRNDLALTKHVLSKQQSARPVVLYLLFLPLIVAILAVQTVVVLLGNIAAKWILLGRRQPGNYDWDRSSYCQRWQLLLKLELFQRACFGGQGILSLLTGTAWLAIYYRCLGAKIGRDCALFAGGRSHMYLTEPDLVILEDRVSVDDASLAAHINTRGRFDLNTLFVGARSVMRANSRLLSGARMEQDSCLLEHTLVMAGDQIAQGQCIQGWPAEGWFSGVRIREPVS